MALTHDACVLSPTPPRAALDRMDRLRGVALWAALGVAISPVLLAWSRSADLGSKYSYLLPIAGVLLHRLWRERDAPRDTPAGSGIPVVAFGVALELAGILGQTQFLMLLALPVTAFGVALQRGWPSRSACTFAFFLVPLPDAVLGVASPRLETLLATGAAALIGPIAGAFESSLEAVGLSLVAGAVKLDLRPGNGGLLLAHFLAALGFARSVSAGDGIFASLRRAALFSCAAIVIQPLGVALAGGMVAAGNTGLARFWLSHGIWCATGLGVLAIWGRAARKMRARSAD